MRGWESPWLGVRVRTSDNGTHIELECVDCLIRIGTHREGGRVLLEHSTHQNGPHHSYASEIDAVAIRNDTVDTTELKRLLSRHEGIAIHHALNAL